MRRYESYKDSGVEWLGEVPSHWNLIPNKYIFKLRKNVVGKRSNEYDLLSLSLKGVIKRDMENPEGKFPAEFDTYQEVKEGDFIFCLFDVEETPRTVGLSSYHGMITGAYTIFETNNVDKKFIYYFYLNLDSDKRLKPLYKGLRNTISKETFFSFNTFIPPLSEQQKIAQFLDEKTAKIDQAVDLAEKQIALLKEHKQILIQNAVTRGLNPDVPLKDSGVEWIGQVPKHWEVKKLKYLAKFSPSKSEITCNHEESCSFIPMEKLKLNTLVLDEIKQIKNVYSAYTYFRDEDLLIAKVTPCFENKNFAIAKNLVNSIGFGSSEIYVLRTYNNLFNRFLFYRLQEQNFMEIAISKMSGTGGLKRVPSEFINNFQLALPPLCEQQKIADYLDKQTAKIDQAIALKTAHIEKLKEYKSVLINDVVTGKVRVSV